MQLLWIVGRREKVRLAVECLVLLLRRRGRLDVIEAERSGNASRKTTAEPNFDKAAMAKVSVAQSRQKRNRVSLPSRSVRVEAQEDDGLRHMEELLTGGDGLVHGSLRPMGPVLA